MSEGTIQSDKLAAEGDIAFQAGARYHPFTVKSILWNRDNTDGITLNICIVSGDRKYSLNGFPKAAFAGKTIVLPDKENPLGIALVPTQRLLVETTNQPGNEVQVIEVQWAELAVP